jgi:hypothetical protein
VRAAAAAFNVIGPDPSTSWFVAAVSTRPEENVFTPATLCAPVVLTKAFGSSGATTGADPAESNWALANSGNVNGSKPPPCLVVKTVCTFGNVKYVAGSLSNCSCSANSLLLDLFSPVTLPRTDIDPLTN